MNHLRILEATKEVHSTEGTLNQEIAMLRTNNQLQDSKICSIWEIWTWMQAIWMISKFQAQVVPEES
jgi:hypothetical protein